MYNHLGTIVNIDPTADVCGVVYIDDGRLGRLYILTVFIANLLKMHARTPAAGEDIFYSKLHSLFSC